MRRGLYRHGRSYGLRERLLLDLPLTYIGSRGASDRMGWGPLDDIASARVFDWASADGLSPAVGPTLSEDGSGTRTAEVATPWQDSDGDNVTCTALTDKALSSTLFGSAPADSDDILLLTLARVTNPSAFAYILSTYHAAAVRGAYIGGNDTVIQARSYAPSGNAASQVVYPARCWGLHGLLIDRGANQTLWTNGHLVDTDVAPTGSITGSSVTLGAWYPGISAQNDGVDVARALVYYGAGLAEICTAAWWRRLAAAVLGYSPATGDGDALYARTGARIYDVGGRLHLLGTNLPPAGHAIGWRRDDAHGTLTYRNAQHAATDDTLFTKDAALTVSMADDSANIPAAHRELGALAVRVQNASGGPLHLRYGDTVGGLSACWSTVRARIVSGSLSVGLWDGTTYTAAGAVVDDYLTKSGGPVTAEDAAQEWGLEIADGTDAYFLLGCLRVGADEPPECYNPSTTAAAAVGEGVITLPSTVALDDGQGRIEAELTPEGWDSTERGGTDRVVTRASTDIDAAMVSDADQQLQCGDGTAEAQHDITEADGVDYVARWSWGSRGLTAQAAGSTEDTAAYDGALGGAGDLEVRAPGRRVRDLRIYATQGGVQS